MANNFVREPIEGGDSNSWATYELQQNRRSEGQMTAYLYNDSGTLKLSTGIIGIYDNTNRGTIVIDTITTVDISSVSNSNWGKVEVSVSGTTITIAVVDISGATTESTIPSDYLNAYDGEKGGYYITATKRCIGIVYKSSVGELSSILSDNRNSNDVQVPRDFNIANKIIYNSSEDTYKFNDFKILTEKNIFYTTKEQIGNDFNIAGISVADITALTENTIAYIDVTNDDLRTYQFDGTDWSQVGNDLNIPTTTITYMTGLTTNTIAFINIADTSLSTYKFDGSDWFKVGETITISGMGQSSLASMTSNIIAYIDITNEDLRAYLCNNGIDVLRN